MMLPPEPWHLLFTADGQMSTSGRAALDAVAAVDRRDASALARLRRTWDPATLSVAIELNEARRKAKRKFPALADLVGDREGVEQATAQSVADHKAARFSRHDADRIYDLCTGLGGDAMSLANVAPVIACDLDPARAWMCERNLQLAGAPHPSDVRCLDVTTIDRSQLTGASVHIDPSRRSERAQGRGAGARHWRYADYQPGPEFIRELLDHARDAAVKLGPGVDVRELPLSATREVEFVQDGGDLVQAVLWDGALAEQPGVCTATQLPGGQRLVGGSFADPAPPAASRDGGGVGRFIAIVEPAAERAGLLATVAQLDGAALAEISPGLGVLTGDVAPVSPWTTTFEVLEVMPWRAPRVRDWLRVRDADTVEVKTRGGAVDANRARAELRGDGAQPYTVFVLRTGTQVRAIISRRVP